MHRPNINTSHLENQFLTTPRTMTHLTNGAALVFCVWSLQLRRGFPDTETYILCCSFLAMLFAGQFSRPQVQIHTATTPKPQVP